MTQMEVKPCSSERRRPNAGIGTRYSLDPTAITKALTVVRKHAMLLNGFERKHMAVKTRDRRQIRSKSDLFRGELVDMPLKAKLSKERDEDGEQKWICPNCSAVIGPDDCDAVGSEPGCLFCNQCNREFRIP